MFSILNTAVLSAVILAAPHTSGPASKTGSAAVIAVADAYVAAVLKGDAAVVAKLYRDDAVEMAPGETPVRGRAAIEAFYEHQFEHGRISNFTIEHLDSKAEGASGYDVGTYRQTISLPNGDDVEDSGKYIVIVKRTGGSWKVAYAIYNSDRGEGSEDTDESDD